VAGLIPQSFINDLIDRVDIVDVIDGRVALKKTGKNYTGLCPFHDEKSPSFSVSPEKQFFHCFGCQESGTALTFLMKFERMEFVEAVETLAKDLGTCGAKRENPTDRMSRSIKGSTMPWTAQSGFIGSSYEALNWRSNTSRVED
jgi:DNA primase